MTPPRVGGVLLAAGESARMGAHKQLLRVGEHSLLCRAAEAAIDSVCRPVVVVLSALSEQVVGRDRRLARDNSCERAVG